MCEEDIKIDEHWSYTIKGNLRALYYYEDLERICLSAMTDDEEKEFDNVDITLQDALKIRLGEETEEIKSKKFKLMQLTRSQIDRCYDKLVHFIRNQNSRLAYIVLGVFLMVDGGKMTKELKEDILKYSDWAYEKHQFKNVEEEELRKKYLIEFREKIKGYIPGVPTLVSEKSLSDVYADHGPFDLTPIKYDIQISNEQKKNIII